MKKSKEYIKGQKDLYNRLYHSLTDNYLDEIQALKNLLAEMYKVSDELNQ